MNALDKAFRLLAMRARTVQELDRALERAKVSERDRKALKEVSKALGAAKNSSPPPTDAGSQAFEEFRQGLPSDFIEKAKREADRRLKEQDGGIGR